jgi:hypothetical protein
MSGQRPVVDAATARTTRLGPVAVLIVIAALGLVLLGARTVSTLLRGLDQDTTVPLRAESPQSGES